MDNPIKTARTRVGRTLKEFAEDCGVHEQAVFLNEQGVYPHVLPAIGAHLRTLGVSRPFEDYAQFQLERRQAAGARFDLYIYSLPAPDDRHPVVAFREAFGMSRMKFAKSFCVHPAELYRLENGQKHGLSEQFKEAMRQAGLRDTVLDELEFRIREYAEGEWIGSNQRGAA